MCYKLSEKIQLAQHSSWVKSKINRGSIHLQVKKHNILSDLSHNSFCQRSGEKWCRGGNCRSAAAQTASISGQQVFELQPVHTQTRFKSQKHTHFSSYFNSNCSLKWPENRQHNINAPRYFKIKGHPHVHTIFYVGFNFYLGMDCASWKVD